MNSNVRALALYVTISIGGANIDKDTGKTVSKM